MKNVILIINIIFQVTWFGTDPFVLIEMIKTDILEKYRLSSLKVILTCGSIFPKQHQETLKKKLPHVFICNGYGKLSNSIKKKLLINLLYEMQFAFELVLKFINNCLFKNIYYRYYLLIIN